MIKGGRKSPVAKAIDSVLLGRQWEEKKFDTRVVVDEVTRLSPTHKVDCFKKVAGHDQGVGLEVEWNNKDPFFDRDLNNFRLLFDLRAMSVGVIVTRRDELQAIFKGLGRGKSYGASTTHMSQLRPRVEGGGGGGCPLLVFGISKELYVEETGDELTAAIQGYKRTEQQEKEARKRAKQEQQDARRRARAEQQRAHPQPRRARRVRDDSR
jgi:Sec-independent protein translocase protein TatA